MPLPASCSLIFHIHRHLYRNSKWQIGCFSCIALLSLVPIKFGKERGARCAYALQLDKTRDLGSCVPLIRRLTGKTAINLASS